MSSSEQPAGEASGDGSSERVDSPPQSAQDAPGADQDEATSASTATQSTSAPAATDDAQQDAGATRSSGSQSNGGGGAKVIPAETVDTAENENAGHAAEEPAVAQRVIDQNDTEAESGDDPYHIQDAGDNDRVMAPNPEENADCCSRGTLEWLTTLMTLGLKRSADKDSLHLEDLGPVAAVDRAQAQSTRFDRLWQEEVDSKPRGEASLMKVWYRFIGICPFIGLVLLKALDVGCVTMAPLINRQLIVYLEGSSENTTSNVTEEVTFSSWCPASAGGAGPPVCETWMLALMVLGLFVSQLASGAIRAFTEFHSKRMAMHSYAALTKAIYNKSLRLSSAVCAGSGGTGKLVNMMSSDAHASIERSVFLLLPVIVAPFQLILYFVLVFLEVSTCQLPCALPLCVRPSLRIFCLP